MIYSGIYDGSDRHNPDDSESGWNPNCNYYFIPFSIHPLEHQPTGHLTINGTNKLKMKFHLNCKSGKIILTAISLRVMRIMSRMLSFVDPINPPPPWGPRGPDEWHIQGDLFGGRQQFPPLIPIGPAT